MSGCLPCRLAEPYKPVEALHQIIRRLRLDRRFDLGYIFAKTASQIPYPERDVLLVSGPARMEFQDELSICAYYIKRYERASIFVHCCWRTNVSRNTSARGSLQTVNSRSHTSRTRPPSSRSRSFESPRQVPGSRPRTCHLSDHVRQTSGLVRGSSAAEREECSGTAVSFEYVWFLFPQVAIRVARQLRFSRNRFSTNFPLC